MIDENYDFGKPRFFPHRLVVFLLLVGIVGIGMYWWYRTVNQQTKIARLTSENQKLRDRLEDSPEPATPKPSAKAIPQRNPKFHLASSSTVKEQQGSTINIDAFVDVVKRSKSESDLRQLNFDADNIEFVMPSLLSLLRQNEHCHLALYALRKIDIQLIDKKKLVKELITVIDSHRFSSETDGTAVNRHAYSFLVTIGKDALAAQPTLEQVMNSDHSPWASYACVTLKLLDPETDVEKRLIELLKNPFQTNRLIAARRIPDYVNPKTARSVLHRAHAKETSSQVRDSLLNSMNRIYALESHVE